jgi:hypothetical protein
MAHDRNRQIGELFSRLLRFSPIVGLFGHRQVGKTTFASAVAATYWTLDDLDTRKRISQSPKLFLEAQRHFPTVIDECQVVPELFPALKEHVRTRKRPGQFILSGSVRFTSRKAIRESLAGRMTSAELLPLTLSELLKTELPDVVPQLLAAPSFTDSALSLLFSRLLSGAHKGLEKYLTNGGLPGLCFVREERLRSEALSALHQLILDRDLRLVVETRLSLETIMRWLRWIASAGFQPYNASEAKRLFGLAHQTQRGLLFALEAIFLIRRIPITGRSGEIILMEDQYEELRLSNVVRSQSEQMLSALFRNIRTQFSYRMGMTPRFESFWLRSGARLPLVLRSETSSLAFAVIDEGAPSLSLQRSAESFQRRNPAGKVIFVALERLQPRLLDSRTLVCSAGSLMA